MSYCSFPVVILLLYLFWWTTNIARGGFEQIILYLKVVESTWPGHSSQFVPGTVFHPLILLGRETAPTISDSDSQ